MSDSIPNLAPPEGVPLEAWLRLARPLGDRWAITERDANGEKVGTAHRFPDGSKGSEKGGKRGLIFEHPLPNYAGSSFAEPVYVTEGASDTATLFALGLVAVGVPMAGYCADWLAALLSGRHVVIVRDADAAGRKGAAKLAAALLPRCASVRVIDPPNGAKDAREAVIGGADRASFEGLTASAGPLNAPASRGDTARAGGGHEAEGEPVLVCTADVEPVAVEWLWPGRIPFGRITVIAGRPGEGKSFVSIDAAARVSTGTPWPDGSACPLSDVLLVCAEDGVEDTIAPRLVACGADRKRVHVLRAVTTSCGGSRGFTLADIPALEQALEQLPACRYVIIDPIGSFLGARVDMHRDNETRAVLAPLAALAERTGVAVALVAHTRKGSADFADDAVLGSRAFTGLARSVLHVMRDPDDEARRMLLPGKCNLAKPAAGLAFKIEGEPARVEWSTEPVSRQADEVLAAGRTGGDRGGALAEAVEWLRDELSAGPQPAAALKEKAKGDGIKLRTLERAKAAVRAKADREGYANNGRWVWQLRAPPPAAAP